MTSSSNRLQSTRTARSAHDHARADQANFGGSSLQHVDLGLLDQHPAFASPRPDLHSSFSLGSASLSSFPSPPLFHPNTATSPPAPMNTHSPARPPDHSTTASLTALNQFSSPTSSRHHLQDSSAQSLLQHHQNSDQLPALNPGASDARGWDAVSAFDDYLSLTSDGSFWANSAFLDAFSSPVQPRPSNPPPVAPSFQDTPIGYPQFQAAVGVPRQSDPTITPSLAPPRHPAPQPSIPCSPTAPHQHLNPTFSTSLLPELDVQHAVASIDGLLNSPLDDQLSSDPVFAPPPPLTAGSANIDSMPSSSRKRNAAPAQAAPRPVSRSSPATKRRRTSHPSIEVSPNRGRAAVDHDAAFADLFDEPFEESFQTAQTHAEDVTTIDLTETNEVPEELKQPVEDKRIKISKFQCVICMDDVKTLTVTHCGHLFCAQCLHQALHVDPTRNKCPMCRSKIESKPRSEYHTRTKGLWPLELKLMTATRKGKRRTDGKT
jgi:hypothetical protein